MLSISYSVTCEITSTLGGGSNSTLGTTLGGRIISTLGGGKSSLLWPGCEIASTLGCGNNSTPGGGRRSTLGATSNSMLIGSLSESEVMSIIGAGLGFLTKGLTLAIALPTLEVEGLNSTFLNLLTFGRPCLQGLLTSLLHPHLRLYFPIPFSISLSTFFKFSILAAFLSCTLSINT